MLELGLYGVLFLTTTVNVSFVTVESLEDLDAWIYLYCIYAVLCLQYRFTKWAQEPLPYEQVHNYFRVVIVFHGRKCH